MSDVDTSAEALRGGVSLLRNLATELLHPERTKLADIIEALAAERDALAVDRDAYKRNMQAAAELAARYGAERDTARAEAQRLQAELREILQWATVEKAPLREQEIASIRAALAGEPRHD